MNKLEHLQGRVVSLRATVEAGKRRCKSIQSDLDKAETNLIEWKEELRRAEEELETYKNTQILSTVDEDLYTQDIAEFRKRMPAAMAKVDEQDRKRAEKESRTELDNFKQKIQDGVVLARKVEGNGNVKCDENPVAQSG